LSTWWPDLGQTLGQRPMPRSNLRRNGVLGLAALSAMAGIAALSGCGFKLQGGPLALPFQRIALLGFAPRSPLAMALREALQRSGAQVLSDPAQAQVQLVAVADARERSVVASTAAGQVREIQLRLRLLFRAATPQGRVLIAPTELLLSRELSFTEAQALAKEQEEAALFAEMQDDVLGQLMRRLAALKV
jgi:LPS-assembly lipoprotein